MTKIILGVNIDHIATVREARKGQEPDLVAAARIAENTGADLITIHLREDRRHIQDEDVYTIKEKIKIPLNLEMALNEEIIEIALKVEPFKITIVPEKREEVTTEGGLDVVKHLHKLKEVIKRFKVKSIQVSLFIEADLQQIKASREVNADAIEIHTGEYANSIGNKKDQEYKRIIEAVNYAKSIGLHVHAGHGLNYENVQLIKDIDGIEELNIGHSIISHAILTGLGDSIQEMKNLLK